MVSKITFEVDDQSNNSDRKIVHSKKKKNIVKPLYSSLRSEYKNINNKFNNVISYALGK